MYVDDCIQCSSLFPSCLFFPPSLLSTVLPCTCIYTQIFLSCLFTRPSTYSLPKSMSLYIPHPALIHIVYSSLKDSPSVMQAVSPPPSHFISLPFPSLFCLTTPPSSECLDRSKWCDCDCSAGRLPLCVCLSASLESLT